MVDARQRSVLIRVWPRSVNVTGLGAAVEGEGDLSGCLDDEGIARGPFEDAGLPPISNRALGARVLTMALRQVCEHPRTGELPEPFRRAVVVGTGTASLNETIQFLKEVESVGPALVNPGLFPFTVMNAAAGFAAIQHTCRGPNLTLQNGPTSLLDALAAAADLLLAKRADMTFAGGFESYGPQASELVGRRGAEVHVAIMLALTAADGAAATCRLAAYGAGNLPDLTPSAAGERLVSRTLEALGAVSAGDPQVVKVGGSRREEAPLEILRAIRQAEGGAPVAILAGCEADSAGSVLVLVPSNGDHLER